MSLPAFRRFTEDPAAPYRLGRHQMHDFLVPEREASARLGTPVKTVQHAEYEDPFDQGQLGSCTANAAYGTLVTDPFGTQGVGYTEDDAVALYELETKLDDTQIPGSYPPDDTGSTGPWSMTGLMKLGLIQDWHHTRNMTTALRLLNAGPISIGVTWYNSFFTPDKNGLLVLSEDDGIGGGHQICITADDTDNRRILIRNSWGIGWGIDGHAWLRWSDFDDLLQDGGDVVQPIIKAA